MAHDGVRHRRGLVGGDHVVHARVARHWPFTWRVTYPRRRSCAASSQSRAAFGVPSSKFFRAASSFDAHLVDALRLITCSPRNTHRRVGMHKLPTASAMRIQRQSVCTPRGLCGCCCWAPRGRTPPSTDYIGSTDLLQVVTPGVGGTAGPSESQNSSPPNMRLVVSTPQRSDIGRDRLQTRTVWMRMSASSLGSRADESSTSISPLSSATMRPAAVSGSLKSTQSCAAAACDKHSDAEPTSTPASIPIPLLSVSSSQGAVACKDLPGPWYGAGKCDVKDHVRENCPFARDPSAEKRVESHACSQWKRSIDPLLELTGGRV
jgi:hypothetical protein